VKGACYGSAVCGRRPCVAGARVWQALVCGRRSCVAGARVCAWYPCVCVVPVCVCVVPVCMAPVYEWRPCGRRWVPHLLDWHLSCRPRSELLKEYHSAYTRGGVHSGAGAEWTAVSDAAVSDAAVSDAARVP
jgi:hypothetical protein